jgi:hypothetical protein
MLVFEQDSQRTIIYRSTQLCAPKIPLCRTDHIPSAFTLKFDEWFSTPSEAQHQQKEGLGSFFGVCHEGKLRNDQTSPLMSDTDRFFFSYPSSKMRRMAIFLHNTAAFSAVSSFLYPKRINNFPSQSKRSLDHQTGPEL